MGKIKRFFEINNKTLSLILLLLIVLTCALDIGCYPYLCLPDNITVSTSGTPALPQAIFSSEMITGRSEQAIPASAEAEPCNSETLDIRVLDGLLTVKSIALQKNEDVYVIPGGQSIGILLQTDGVTVVGHSPITDANGCALYPARDAGINTGDFITSVNDVPITCDTEVAHQVQLAAEKNEDVKIVFRREQQEYTVAVTPQYCCDTQSYRIGLYVRDNTAGVGTLTFLEPKSGKYGALGHQINDPEGKNTNADKKGSIIRASIEGIKPGQAGTPGEKLGAFVSNTWKGTIEKNCLFGIFGVLAEELENPLSEVIPVACCNEVAIGPAQIYTVLDGENIECFDIQIVKLLPNYKLSGKGMVIEVTDPELLRRTGGIVQGMSGSPIIQNGKLVGAVTHVFINDPQRGYGCMAQWMLEEAGLW